MQRSVLSFLSVASLSLVLAACGGGGGGGDASNDVLGDSGSREVTGVKLGDIVGWWDASSVVDGARDAYYVQIKRNGLAQDYDWQADDFDMGDNCYLTYQYDEHLVFQTDASGYVKNVARMVQKYRFDRDVQISLSLDGDTLTVTVTDGGESETFTLKRISDPNISPLDICLSDFPVFLSPVSPDRASRITGKYQFLHGYVKYENGQEVELDRGTDMTGSLEITDTHIHPKLTSVSLGRTAEFNLPYRKASDGLLEVTQDDGCVYPIYYQWNSFGQFVTRFPAACGVTYSEVEAWRPVLELPRNGDVGPSTQANEPGGLAGGLFAPY